ncbi:MAG: class I SAM-dependent methyltransferase [Cyanophyceae cyanobacterium]
MTSSSAPSPAAPSVDVDKVRQQFDGTPYPWLPMDTDPQKCRHLFLSHCAATAFYARDRHLDHLSVGDELSILDVGCGSGFKGLLLAHANPGARVLGIDISGKSIELAQERAEFQGMADALEFRVMDIADLAKLEERFDYINCDEVLYLLPDPAAALAAMKAALKPQGIIRTNLHNRYQRSTVYDAQDCLQRLAMWDWPDQRQGIETVEAWLNALDPSLGIARMWQPHQNKDVEDRAEVVMANLLLQGDRGFSVLDMAQLLAAADLHLARMVEPQDWDVLGLFRDRKALPEPLPERLATLDQFEKMHLHELLSPSNRLIDFWCSPVPARDRADAATWTDADWGAHAVALHPLLHTPEFQEQLFDAARTLKPLDLRKLFPVTHGMTVVSSQLTPALVPLLDGPQSRDRLLQRLLEVYPLNPVTGEATDRDRLKTALTTAIVDLEAAGYLLLPPQP